MASNRPVIVAMGVILMAHDTYRCDAMLRGFSHDAIDGRNPARALELRQARPRARIARRDGQ
jgi:hypothetical protein